MHVTVMEAAEQHGSDLLGQEALQHHVFHLGLEALVLGMYMAVGIVMRFCQKYSHSLNSFFIIINKLFKGL